MDHNFGQFYNYLAYLSTIKYGTVRDIKLSPNQFSFLYKKKAKSSQLKCVVFLPTQFRFVFFFSRTTAAASNGTAAAGAATPANKNGESSGKNAISAALNSAQSAQRREDIRLTKMMLIIFLSFLVRKEAYNWIIFHLLKSWTTLLSGHKGLNDM